MLSKQNRNIIRLIARSADIGEGWRQASFTTWPLLMAFPHAELIERDTENVRVRLTEKGRLILKYLV